jgi:RNA polymerase primary sigma factor
MRQLKIGQKVTVKDTGSLSRYLKEAKKCRLLTIEEEGVLAMRSRNGDLKAQEILITSNLLFVVSVAKNYQNYGISLGDLICEGNIGLIKASKEFDPTRGFKFISYAIWPIRQSIIYAITDQLRILRLPQNLVGSLSKINKSINILQQELERLPTPAEISEHIKISEDKVKEYMENAKPTVSLDAIINEENGHTLLDTIHSDDFETDSTLMRSSLKHQVNVVMRSLSSKQRDIISLHYGLNDQDPIPLEEIALLYGLSKERIRQIKDLSLKKLKARNLVLSQRIANI